MPGLLGGLDGPNGKLIINGKEEVGGGDVSVPPGGVMACHIPGGAGLGDPLQRSRSMVERDIEYEYVSRAEAARLYGYTAPVLQEVE